MKPETVQNSLVVKIEFNKNSEYNTIYDLSYSI